MARCEPSPFAPRPRRALLLLLPLALLATSGCKHHRSALRPVYGAPVVTVPAGDCGPGMTGPDCNTPASPMSTSPGTSAAPTILPESDSEPGLEPASPASSTGSGPALDAPKTGRQTERRPASARRATLRSRVEPFTNDPNDLFLPPKADRAWRYIVLHHSAHDTGSLAQIDRDHRKELGTDGCGYHFVIGNGTESPDGQIEVARRWSDQKAGAHCRDARTPDVNDYGIGICLVGDLDKGQPTPKQIESARALVAYLAERYKIAPERAGTHAALAHKDTACPGKNFPVEAILKTRGLASR